MRKIISLLLFVFLFLDGFTQVDATFTLKRFNSLRQPYIENYLKIYVTSISLKEKPNENIHYSIQVTQILRQDSNIIDFKKYIIQPLDSIKNNILNDLIDQQRFNVENNQQYTLEVIIEDLISEVTIPKKIEKVFDVNFSDSDIEFSDIQLIEQYSRASEPTSITKSGYNIVPMAEDFYGDNFDKIAYYTEVYNTSKKLDTNGKYLINQFIEYYETEQLVGEYNKIKRYSSSKIQPILNVWDIEALPTGNYNLVLQVKNRKNEVIAEKKQRFQRLNLSRSVQIKDLNTQSYSNTFVDAIPPDSLTESIKCLLPIASELERSTIEHQVSKLTDNMKREFIYQFWKNQNSLNPGKSWREYQNKLKYVHQEYSTRTLKGYETDRGRIYLLYGMPNSINDKPNSNNSYPYQVWHYYRAGKFNNKTCIFYSPNMIGNEYLLLHSDIPGENKDLNWQRTLKKRSNGASNEELRHQSWEQY
jgi:GWxTD domain-containing protein